MDDETRITNLETAVSKLQAATSFHSSALISLQSTMTTYQQEMKLRMEAMAAEITALGQLIKDKASLSDTTPLASDSDPDDFLFEHMNEVISMVDSPQVFDEMLVQTDDVFAGKTINDDGAIEMDVKLQPQLEQGPAQTLQCFDEIPKLSSLNKVFAQMPRQMDIITTERDITKAVPITSVHELMDVIRNSYQHVVLSKELVWVLRTTHDFAECMSFDPGISKHFLAANRPIENRLHACFVHFSDRGLYRNSMPMLFEVIRSHGVGFTPQLQRARASDAHLEMTNVYYRHSVDGYILPLALIGYDPGGRLELLDSTRIHLLFHIPLLQSCIRHHEEQVPWHANFVLTQWKGMSLGAATFDDYGTIFTLKMGVATGSYGLTIEAKDVVPNFKHE